MEIKLNNNDRVRLSWLGSNMLRIEVHTLDHQEWRSAGSRTLGGAELQAFLLAFRPPSSLLTNSEGTLPLSPFLHRGNHSKPGAKSEP